MAVNKNKKWEKNVEAAKFLVKNRRLAQFKIAELALEVCEISYGGVKHKGQYTIKRFAAEVGISTQALSNWIGIKVSTYDKIPPALRSKGSFTIFSDVAKTIQKDDSSETVQKAFKAIMTTGAFDRRMRRYLQDIRAASYNFDNGAALKCEEITISEYLFYAEKIITKIKEDRPGAVAGDHSLALTARKRAISAATAILPDRDPAKTLKWVYYAGTKKVQVTPKDRDILLHLKKSPNEWHSPSKIGMELHGAKRDSASAWAYRTLQKFLPTGIVEVNKAGKYKWVE